MDERAAGAAGEVAVPAGAAPRRRRPPLEAPVPALSRARLLLAVGVLGAAGCTTLATHFVMFPWPFQATMRDWALHSCGLLATTLATGLCLGLHRAHRRAARRALTAIALGVPLTITLLHELGQWLWPADPRDAFDAVRDCVLNVVGAAVAGALLRSGQRPEPPPPSAAGAAG
jgi:hypothetical protein